MAARQYWVGDNGQIYSSTNPANIPTDRPTYSTHAGASAQASVSATSAGNWPSTAQGAGYSYGVEMPQPGNPNNPDSANYGVGQNGGWPVPPADQYANWPGPGWFWNGYSWQRNLTNEESYQDWINGGAQGWAQHQAQQAAAANGGIVGGGGGSGGMGQAGPSGTGGYSATPTSPSPGADYIWDGFKWVMDPRVLQQRANAAALLNAKFAEYGISGLAPQIEAWLKEGYSADTIALLIRDTPQYAQRFPAMKELTKRGMALSEAEYIAQERAYRDVMTSYGLPTGFYDSPDDYAGFMLNQVSAQELDDRVYTAKRFLDSSNPAYMNALQSYYGVDRGAALAYLLDANKAQDVIRQQVRAAEVGGAAATYGFELDQYKANQLANTALGQAVDPFNPTSLAQYEQRMKDAADWNAADRKLAGIETGPGGKRLSPNDALDVAFGDREKELASRKRAAREVGRFSGTSALTNSSLGARRAQ